MPHSSQYQDVLLANLIIFTVYFIYRLTYNTQDICQAQGLPQTAADKTTLLFPHVLQLASCLNFILVYIV